MNANELADLLEVDSWYKLVTREEIATMLRQQQAEIESLKDKLYLTKQSLDIVDSWIGKAQEKWPFKKYMYWLIQVEEQAVMEKLRHIQILPAKMVMNLSHIQYLEAVKMRKNIVPNGKKSITLLRQ